MRQGSRVQAHPLPTPPRKREREQTECAALPADYLLHEIPGPFVPAKAGTQIVSHRLDSRLRGSGGVMPAAAIPKPSLPGLTRQSILFK
jgi:hypothetical protein